MVSCKQISVCSQARRSGREEKRWFPSFPCCPVNRQCLWKKTVTKKNSKTKAWYPWHLIPCCGWYHNVVQGLKLYYCQRRKRERWYFLWGIANLITSLFYITHDHTNNDPTHMTPHLVWGPSQLKKHCLCYEHKFSSKKNLIKSNFPLQVPFQLTRSQ